MRFWRLLTDFFNPSFNLSFGCQRLSLPNAPPLRGFAPAGSNPASATRCPPGATRHPAYPNSRELRSPFEAPTGQHDKDRPTYWKLPQHHWPGNKSRGRCPPPCPRSRLAAARATATPHGETKVSPALRAAPPSFKVIRKMGAAETPAEPLQVASDCAIGNRLRGWAAGLAFFALSPAHAIDLAARVSWVEDGDTVIAQLKDGQPLKVRLAMIDAPEVCHLQRDPTCRRRGQAFGVEATQSLQQLVGGKDVRLECERSPDRYGRSVCVVWAGAIEVNKEQVARGLAWYSPARSRSGGIQAAELGARLSRKGLWSQAAAVKPADWRRVCWDEGRCG
jgi:micrococcal nuclease